MWKEKDRKIDETELQILKQELRDDKVAIENQKEYEARSNDSGILMRINRMLGSFEGDASKKAERKAKRKGRGKRVVMKHLMRVKEDKELDEEEEEGKKDYH